MFDSQKDINTSVEGWFAKLKRNGLSRKGYCVAC